MAGTLKRLNCKAVGPRAVNKHGKGVKTRTVSIRSDGAFQVTKGPLRGRRCSIRNPKQDAARRKSKIVKRESHRHQGDMRPRKKRGYQ